jgi:hypothetical protein
LLPNHPINKIFQRQLHKALHYYSPFYGGQKEETQKRVLGFLNLESVQLSIKIARKQQNCPCQVPKLYAACAEASITFSPAIGM